MHLPATNKVLWTIAPLLIGLLAPSVILFCVALFVGHQGAGAAICDIAHRQFAEGENFFLIALIGLIPFVALSVTCLLAARRLTAKRLTCLGVGGLLGILGVMVPSHASIWHPLYAGQHVSSTAVIAFLFVPFLCLVTLVVGLLIGWAVSRMAFARGASN